MSGTGVRYQVSGIRCQVITCQVPVSDTNVRYRVSSNNMSSTGVRYQVSGIRCQVYTYQGQVIHISVPDELNAESQYHISTRIVMNHVLKARVAIVRHETAVKRHPHINI